LLGLQKWEWVSAAVGEFRSAEIATVEAHGFSRAKPQSGEDAASAAGKADFHGFDLAETATGAKAPAL
jgi:hypothetical protein